MTYVAIDFETANYNRDSACEIGLAWVENGRIIKNKSVNFLIRPPTKYFNFTALHGIEPILDFSMASFLHLLFFNLR